MASAARAAEVAGAHGRWAEGRRLLRRARRYPLAVAGLLVILLYAAAALLAPVLAPHGVGEFSLAGRLKPPVGFPGALPGYWLGTDSLGHDLLSHVIWGARVSMAVGFLSVGVAALVGTGLGLVAGYYGGKIDAVLSRLADLLMAFPYLLFTILVMSLFGPGFLNLVLALSFKAWVEFFRLMRGEVLVEKHKEYVEAAHAIGRRDLGIMLREILPNILPTLLVVATLRFGYMVIMEASLSFLGLGMPPDVPTWGAMVAAGREKLLQAWWVSTVPGVAILLLVLSMNVLGEGLRDLLDPRLKDR